MAMSKDTLDTECEKALNRQINKELQTAYAYMCMSTYFSEENPTRNGFSKYFFELMTEAFVNKQKIGDFLRKRGISIRYEDIPKPKQKWSTPHEAMKDAFHMETEANQAVTSLSYRALEVGDAELLDFVEKYLDRQKKSLYDTGCCIKLLSNGDWQLEEKVCQHLLEYKSACRRDEDEGSQEEEETEDIESLLEALSIEG